LLAAGSRFPEHAVIASCRTSVMSESCCFGFLQPKTRAANGCQMQSDAGGKKKRPGAVQTNWVEKNGRGDAEPVNTPGMSSPVHSPGSPKVPKRKMAHVFLEKPKIGSVAMVGAPLADGQPIGGVDLAPDAIRNAGLQAVIEREGWTFKDTGDVPRPANDPELARTLAAPRRPEADDRTQYFDPKLVMNSKVVGHSVKRVYDAVSAANSDGSFVLTVGGDHSIAAGSIAGIMKQHPDLAVIWIDAHGDCNTPDSSPSAHYHGMPLAHVLGWFDKKVEGFEWMDDHFEKYGELAEDRVALIGLRDVDPAEAQMLKNSGVHVYTMREIDKYGIGDVMASAIRRVDPEGKRPLHLSFDIDACDPTVAPGTGTCSRGGLTYREAHYICEELVETGRFESMDIVEVNPSLDVKSEEHMHGDDPLISGTQTVRLAVELVSSAIGKKTVGSGPRRKNHKLD